jgi:hypothetical protein
VHILNTLKKRTKYTKNRNDYLFNLNILKDVDIMFVYRFIKLILENREVIYRMNESRRKEEDNYKRLIKEALEDRRNKVIEDYREKLRIKDVSDKNYKGVGYVTIKAESDIKIKYSKIEDPDERIRLDQQQKRKKILEYRGVLKKNVKDSESKDIEERIDESEDTSLMQESIEIESVNTGTDTDTETDTESETESETDSMTRIKEKLSELGISFEKEILYEEYSDIF